ncbi:MAG: sigma-70 family RNA polymerase sigma factor [Verrucomicrobia bacterium]|nr:MAG: sigma-70 family RNA polymerase sigma factor [Verrucomicrobiota bacterium]TAE89380.1 MAG: sigma-70 family RNA polymerase sigma factor [Verrucomicrobiota bacterium]TAF27744.1 MAG: sigma-70 family RNA polymerase sigma factor [Verrucomicrobiota bacterium]TAF42593.1 MAG: sigma-70 family RNA polymerase sigma factor [Verrucomicrobiota bacterium]
MNIFQRNASKRLLGPAEVGGGASGRPVEPALVEDEALVSRAQVGDMRAYDELVTRHRGKIYAMIRNLVRNETDAWDLSQEVFIKAWQALPRFEAKARFSTWLYRIAHNAVCDHGRRRRPEGGVEINDEIFNRERIDPAALSLPSDARRPDEALAGDELRMKIEAALSKLSLEHREAVILKDVQGLSYKEIADVMHCTIGTVMSRLFYARQKLQTLLKDEYDSR